MKVETFTPEFVGTVPRPLKPGILYVSERFQTAIHLCACGCDLETVTPFSRPDDWKYTREGDLVTLDPSIGNFQFPCKAHYYIRQNQVHWCD